eukprot:g20752.t1
MRVCLAGASLLLPSRVCTADWPGHRAQLRDGKFRTNHRFTPVVSSISRAAAIISNVTWHGDLKKMLELNMRDIFEDTGEKRNATEIMHAYLGTGEEILADKGSTCSTDQELLRLAADRPTINAHIPKTEILAKHKVIRFGTTRKAPTDDEAKLYSYLHQRADLKVSRGSIPVGFYSCMKLAFPKQRTGVEDGKPVGPQFQISWKADKEVIPPLDSMSDGWYKEMMFAEDVWDCFEVCVLWMGFCKGIFDASADASSGRSFFSRPTRTAADRARRHVRHLWGLGRPWQVTWKHPFYDYFRQLRDFCRQASKEEVMQVRCNRLLWSYEATRIEAEHDHDPLISPNYVARMADIFGFDVKTQGCVCDEMLQRDVAKYSEMVTHWSSEVKDDVKFDLNKLAAGEMYCVNCKIVALSFCLECKEPGKHRTGGGRRMGDGDGLHRLAGSDYLCLKCYADLHSKGSRKEHAPFCLVPCALCVQLPAKIHCTFTDKSLCHKCYAMSHIKMLPLDGKENQPRRINYVEQYNRYAEFAKERVKKIAVQPEEIPALDDAAYESVLSTDWHPFYDARGVKYYHNFATGERMRQSPRRVPNMDDVGAEGVPHSSMDVAKIVETTNELLENEYVEAKPLEVGSRAPATEPRTASSATAGAGSGPMPLSGFDSLKSDVPAAVKAAEEPEQRLLRPPHRTHMPNVLEAGAE